MSDFEHRGGTKSQTRPRRLAALAARQQGTVATCQLRRIGFSPREIAKMVERGHLQPVFRGVHAVGHGNLTIRGRWMAAVLACGGAAMLSHSSACALWELRPVVGGPIEVTVSGTGRRSRGAIRVHSARSLSPADRVRLHGIPVTSLSRTLLDAAAIQPEQRFRLTLEAAQRSDAFNLVAIDKTIRAARGHHGIRPLLAAIAHLRDEPPETRSELERRFLAVVRAAGLPEPQLNVPMHGFLLDAYFPQYRLVVEVDGWKFHRTRRSFESDRRRDTVLAVAGLQTVRLTRERLKGEPVAVAEDLIRIAAARS